LSEYRDALLRFCPAGFIRECRLKLGFSLLDCSFNLSRLKFVTAKPAYPASNLMLSAQSGHFVPNLLDLVRESTTIAGVWFAALALISEEREEW